MYLRPRQCFTKYLVFERQSRLDLRGREVVEFIPTAAQILGAVSTLKSYEMERFKHTSLKVDFVIVQRGSPKAKIGDLLVCAEKKFLIQYVENILEQWTLYYVERRFDL